MYESSCSYQTALDLKRTSPIAQVKSKECFGLTQCSPDWASYRFHQSTFEQLKQSVEKAKAVLQDRTGFLGTSAFSDIYSAPHLTEPLENVSSFSSTGGILGVNPSISGTINANSISQRHRIETLKTSSASSLSQSIDTTSCDSRHRQEKSHGSSTTANGMNNALRSVKCEEPAPFPFKIGWGLTPQTTTSPTFIHQSTTTSSSENAISSNQRNASESRELDTYSSYKSSWGAHSSTQSQGYTSNALSTVSVGKSTLDAHSHFRQPELKANIGGPSDLYVKSGSDINLQCKISQGPHELGNIFWYKGNEIVDMVGHENEIYSKTTQRITEDTDWADGLISRLKIRRATPNDSGNYSCVPTIAKRTSVYVHVIIGEHPAAMQHNSARATTTITSTNSVLMVLYITIFWQTLLAQFVNAIYSRWFNGLVR